MTDTAQPSRRSHRKKSNRIGPITAFVNAMPYIAFGIVLGFIIYNPSGWSLYHLFNSVFLNGGGQMSDETGKPLAFYLQPANIGLVIIATIIGGFIYFKWEIARDEKIFLSLYAFLWILMNLLFIALVTIFTGDNPFGVDWVRWQIVPALVSALAFGANLPKIRRAYSGAITAGGGSFDDNHDDHDHHPDVDDMD